MDKGNSDSGPCVANNEESVGQKGQDQAVSPEAAAEGRGASLSPPRAGSAQRQGELGDEDEGEQEEDKPEQPLARQDLFVCFTNDKDLRHHETISIKAALYKGIAIKVKILNDLWIENILFAIVSASDKGIINIRFEECRLLKKAVQRLIEFCKNE